jgi:hypothetical protein
MNLKNILFLFLLSYQVSYSQYDAAIKSYVPTTPTAAAFAKVAEVPVNKFSGSSSISIPLYEIMDNQLKSNISLSYSTSGIRASELSSQVGLGWNLNAGGVITRSVRGLPDERLREGQISGFYTDGFNTAWLSEEAKLIEIEAGKRDTEADIFYYNFDGYSGSFQFNQLGRIVQKSKTELKILPVNTGYSYNRLLWKIITPDGNIYYFGDSTIDDIYDDAVSYTNQYIQPLNLVGAPPTSYPSVDAWFLVKAETWDGSSNIAYEYDEYESYSFRDMASSLTTLVDAGGRNIVRAGNNGANPIYNNLTLDEVNRIVCTEALSPRLTKVVTSKGSYIFEYGTQTRRDLDKITAVIGHPKDVIGMPPAKIRKPQALKSVKMLGKTGILINQYNLATSYFQSGYDGFLETLGMTQQSDSDGLHYSDMRRLRLDEVTMNVNGTIIHKHSLEYNESVIPRRWTFAIDEYGYPNGQTTNKNLVPKIKIDDAGLATSPQVDLTGLTVIDLANRDADDFYSKKLMLKKITYPTSGSTSLIYEGHSHYTTRIIESSINAVDLKFDNCSSPQTTCPTCCLAQKKTTLPTVLNFTNPLYRYEMMITAVKTADDNSNVPIDVLLRTRSLPFPNMQLFDDIVLDAGNGFSVQK